MSGRYLDGGGLLQQPEEEGKEEEEEAKSLLIVWFCAKHDVRCQPETVKLKMRDDQAFPSVTDFL